MDNDYTMASMKPGLHVGSTASAASKQDNRKKLKRRRRFWAKETVRTKKNTGSVLPPRVAVEYSTNWKTLSQLMSKATNAKKVPESKSKIRLKEDTLTVGKENHQGIKPEKGAESNTQPDSQATHVVQKGKRLKPDESTAQGTQQSTRKRTRNSQESAEERTSGRKKQTKIEPETENQTEPDIWFDDVDPDDIEAAMGPEAARVARQQIAQTTGKPHTAEPSLEKVLVKDGAFQGLTKAVAMDCEMVGVGSDKVDSILARVSIVNQFGKCIYDKYVKPTEKVTDYRTWVSGVRPADMKNGEDFKVVQREVAEILEGRVLVGHAVHNDLKILFLDHPKKNIRDTQKYKPFKTAVRCGRPSLKHLCSQVLKVKVQESEHSSVQDAQATMRLYTLVRQKWEAEVKAKYRTKKQVVKVEKPNLEAKSLMIYKNKMSLELSLNMN
ncbi:RNA exonuclease 4 isoform X2 [Chiloscyllium plagiosum]|uniref:RNA exonuclease 4 isoform X2 n=1 Tax=Chiloscyllium plagiosum TaxID=36176 RepID=UPI001CB84258|nr:RNA exonuclease 4 isoform X2 [Chiloscyllium plagiosum]